jgi:leucyl-tRNA synthetase
MEYNNALIKLSQDTPAIQGTQVWSEALETMMVLLSPLCPHITEELWHIVGNTTSVHEQALPEFDAALAADELVTLVVQINGKVRDRVDVPAGLGEEEARQAVLSIPKVAAALEGKAPKKFIYVPGKLANIVI